MASVSSFALRQRAAEGQWFNTEGQLALMRHLEKMVEQGKLDRAVLEAAERAQQGSAASVVVNPRREYVYEHKPGLVPVPRVRDYRYMQMGTQISLGRARWTSDDASIFSVADGKRLASTPPTSVTYQESVRMARMQRAALQTPTVAGYRLLPEFTPGRALMWGTVLALWGVAGLVASTARQLDIHTAEEAPGRLRQVVQPWAEGLERWFAPLRGSMSVTAASGDSLRAGAEQSALIKQLRARLMT